VPPAATDRELASRDSYRRYTLPGHRPHRAEMLSDIPVPSGLGTSKK
jgi:hypothetical protein